LQSNFNLQFVLQLWALARQKQYTLFLLGGQWQVIFLNFKLQGIVVPAPPPLPRQEDIEKDRTDQTVTIGVMRESLLKYQK
jgi:hypothetical protein